MTHRSSQSLAGGNGATANVPVPAGAANQDIGVVGIYKENTASITTVPSGFTLKAQLDTSAASRGSLWVYWKRLTAGDTGTWNFAWTGSTWRGAVSGLWSGRITTGDPFDGAPGTAESTTSVATLNATATPGTAGGDAVGMWTDFTGGNAWTPPANYTEQRDIDILTLITRDNIASGSTGAISPTANVSGFLKAFLGVLLPAAGGGTDMPLANAAETDAAQAASHSKLWTPPAAAETNTARELIVVKAPVFPVAAEADTAQPAAAAKLWLPPAAAETDTAQSLSVTKAPQLGAAAETDTAHAMTFAKGLALAAATETDTARAADFTQGSGTPMPLAAATEADTAHAIGHTKGAGLLSAAESDQAGPVAVTKALGFAGATETHTAHAMAFSKGAVLATATETSAAHGLQSGKVLALARVPETDTALEMTLDSGGVGPEYEAPTEWAVSTPAGAVAAGRSQAFTAVTRRTPYTAATRSTA